MTGTTYPEHVAAKLPAGWRARLERLAAADNRPLGAYLRDLIRKHLESADRAERRQRQREEGR